LSFSSGEELWNVKKNRISKCATAVMNRVPGKECAVIVYNTTCAAGSFRPAVSRMMRSGLTTGLLSIFPAWWPKRKYNLNRSVPGSRVIEPQSARKFHKLSAEANTGMTESAKTA